MPKFPIENGITTFGMHLMLDAYKVPVEKLDDMKLVFKFLNELPNKIQMNKISSPLVINAEETASEFDPGGISGIVLIAESHISIHTFPKKGFFTLDLYSCSNFEDEVEEILQTIKEYFPFEEHEIQVVKRGLKYPMNVK